MPDEVINDIPAVDTRKNLLEQDDAQTLVTLVNAAGTVTGTGGQLQLVDENGQAISHSQTFDVTQGGEVVAQEIMTISCWEAPTVLKVTDCT